MNRPHPSPRQRTVAFVAALLGALLASCSELRTEGEQCVFNDDCAAPLVCAGRRCRAQCRGGRDCAPGTVCIPSENPLESVCVPPTEPSICGGDGHCPPAAVCLDHACWWTCGAAPECAARSAGVCQLPPGLCASPVTARVQADAPRPLFMRPPVGPTPDVDAAVATPDAVAPDVASTDAPPADAPAPPDAPVTDAAPDAPAMDAAPDAPVTDAAPDAPVMDAAPDARAMDAADVPQEPGPVPCGDGADCVLPHATGRCSAGRCAVASCTSGFTDCNLQPSDGCEAATGADVMNCGSCGARCPTPAHTTVGCASGMCIPAACEAGFGDCDGDPANGCEVDFATNNRHCGGCGQTCFRSNVTSAACTAGRCLVTACGPGFGDCDRTGAPSPVTAPTAEFANGCETALDADARHCGGCGVQCDPTSGRCVRGACVSDAPIGWSAAPTSPLRELTLVAVPGMAPTVVTVASGTYNLDQLVVPVGVELRVSGTGYLDLRVTGEARIDGTIDLSGGDGGDSVPTADPARRAGGGGGTGTVVHGAPTTATACSQTGGAGGSAGTPGQWAAGDRSCGGPGQLGGGAGGTLGLGGSGGGGVAGAGGGAGTSGNGGAGTLSASGGTATARGGEGGTAFSTSNPYNGRGGGACALGASGVGGGGSGSIGITAARDVLAGRVLETGSGGGGGGGSATSPGAGGGGGGGMLRIVSATRIRVAGRLLVNGGRGGNVRSATPEAGGAGGGGSGGLLSLVAPVVAVEPTALLSARGGEAGGVTFEGAAGSCTAPGGAGGLGRLVIRTPCATWAPRGTFVPALVACESAAMVAGTIPAGIVVDYP